MCTTSISGFRRHGDSGLRRAHHGFTTGSWLFILAKFVLTMPTVFRHGPYRFFFFSDEGNEPIHVHVERDDHVAKFWVQPVSPADAGGFTARELGRIERLVIRHSETIIKRWHEHFDL